MAYVPGFAHDVFVSYAHGDDREWIASFVTRLSTSVGRRLGTPIDVWLDADDLRKSRNFEKDIPESVRKSAVFLLLPSPTYIRSNYCVEQECGTFADTLAARRTRFSAPIFANELYALRCPILPVDGNEHWSLFQGVSDIAFHSETGTFPSGSAEFEKSFGQLVGELAELLKRLRNHSTSVFMYPARPGAELTDAHTCLTAELSAHSYRVLPDRNVKLAEQLRDASMSVFLLGQEFDETAGELVDLAAQLGKPWVAWCAPEIERAGADQAGFCAYVEQLDSPAKMFLNAGSLPTKLKGEVIGLLRPDANRPAETGGKPRVYLVYNARDVAERKNAGLISYNFRKEFHFDHPDDPAQHTQRLVKSDAVLLVWGNADEDWCSREFLEIIQAAPRSDGRGLCLFDPKEAKVEAVEELRRSFSGLYVGEQFGKFDPGRLDAFFTPLRRRSAGAQP